MTIDSTIIGSIIGAVATIFAGIAAAYISNRKNTVTTDGHAKSIKDRTSDSNYIELKTWGGRSNFKYKGNINTGIELIFGNNNRFFIRPEKISKLLEELKGKTIQVGSAFKDPKKDTLEYWLQNNVTKTSISTYLASVLVNEKIVQKNNDNNLLF